MDEQLAPEDHEALRELFVAASAPATATELAAGSAVLASFDSITAELLSSGAFFAEPELEDGPLPGLLWGGEPAGRRSRNAAKMAAAAAVAVLAMGGTAAAATGSLPAPLQSLAHKAFGAPDEHRGHVLEPLAPVVPPAGRTSPRPNPTHAATPAPTPTTAPTPQATPAGTPQPNATPEPTSAPTAPANRIARDACRTLATGKGGSRIDAWETLLPLAGGEPVWRYCATVPGTPQFAWIHGAAAQDGGDDRRGADGDRSDRDARHDGRHEARDDRRDSRREARDDRRDSRREAREDRREDRRQWREDRAQLREQRQAARDSRDDDRGDGRVDRRAERRERIEAPASPTPAGTSATGESRIVTIRIGDVPA